MFLDLDKKDADKMAVIDNAGHKITYNQLIDLSLEIGEKTNSRSVVFCLCKNEAGSLAGYIGFIENDTIPLTLSSNIDKGLLSALSETYTPKYYWLPEECCSMVSGKIIFSSLGYVLLETNNEVYPVNNSLQLLMTTSGSTGSPKLVRYKKGNLEANAKNVAIAFGWSDKERAICDLGMNYTMGLNVINTHLYAGATVLLTTYNLMSSNFWDYIKQEKGTNFTGVPFSYDILARLHFENMDLPELYTLAEGGGKLTDKRFIELSDYAIKSGKRFIPTFGTTETSARLSMLPAELASQKTGSIGFAIPEGELFLIDDEGNVIDKTVAEGEMCYRGPNVTMGYAICKEDLLKGDEWNGEFHTGDLARRDEDGCYYITGRKSRFLKLLSYRVGLDQSERMISEHFNIECACTGTDQRMDIYITDRDIKNDVLAFISKKTGLYKNLFKVIILDKIPRNDSGKISYKELG
jgi:Acyl-CoA synthetases (AMP-forming)/AMP-acid ligases II